MLVGGPRPLGLRRLHVPHRAHRPEKCLLRKNARVCFLAQKEFSLQRKEQDSKAPHSRIPQISWQDQAEAGQSQPTRASQLCVLCLMQVDPGG